MPNQLPKTQIISTVLSPAVRLWLRSQVESAEVLQFEIQGSDRQLLSGQIPQVSVFGKAVIYQGLRLSHLEIVGEGIEINLGQVLRGKPLRLLHPITVAAVLHLQEADLNACLQSPLLAKVLSDLLDQWVGKAGTLPQDPGPEAAQTREHQWEKIQIVFGDDRLVLGAALVQSGQPDTVIQMDATVNLFNEKILYLEDLKWTCDSAAIQTQLETLQKLTLDLGSDVVMESLTIHPGQVSCQGKILIRP
jgi:hypothetical protein